MFGQDDQLRVGSGTQCQCDLARQPKAGTAVRNPDQVVAETITGERFATFGAGEVVCGIGVGVIDMRERQKPMQEGLNGRARTARLIEAVGQVVNHLAVTHALTI